MALEGIGNRKLEPRHCRFLKKRDQPLETKEGTYPNPRRLICVSGTGNCLAHMDLSVSLSN